jgi:hypothetical protein
VQDEPSSERQLLLKLALTEHLSVPERRLLPFGKARGPLLVDTIVTYAEENFAFPSGFNSECIGEVVGMFKDSDGIWQVLRSTEVSYMHFEVVERRAFNDVRLAAEHVVKTRWPVDIDGVSLVW